MPRLSTYGLNTLGIDHKIQSLTRISSVDQLQTVLHDLDDPVVLGGGSNVLFTQDLNRPLIVMDNTGIQIVRESKSHAVVRVGAGTNWHSLVEWAIQRDLGGIENLSLIPGRVGAAPMQNIGAYGVELQDVFESLLAIERATSDPVEFSLEECEFGYRDSIFKRDLKDEMVIVEIQLRLTKKGSHKLNTSYGAIEEALATRKIKNAGIRELSEVIIDIRKSKLPDPVTSPNAGSFFKNPVITDSLFQKIQKDYEVVPHYPAPEGHVKVPAGWLIERCGWKGKRVGRVGTYPKQALVIVNYGVKSGREILDFAKMIEVAVLQKFDIQLEREVNVY